MAYITVGSYLRVGAETVRVVDPAQAQVAYSLAHPPTEVQLTRDRDRPTAKERESERDDGWASERVRESVYGSGCLGSRKW